MDLVIHDLNAEEWNKISGEYDGWNAIADNGAMHPCVGCFSCWTRDPGRCAIKDGYENMGELIHRAGEVVVISRYTCGGFSGSVKNVFDRCLGYVLPQFEVVKGETHHKKRYGEDKPFTFIFYGRSLSDREKESARRYVRAVCANIRGHVKDVIFRESPAGDAEEAQTPEQAYAAPGMQACTSDGGVVLLNVSMRSATGNSAKFARRLAQRLETAAQIINLKDRGGDIPGLLEELAAAGTIVLCAPLYVDGLPSQAVRLMEKFGAEYRGGAENAKRIYLLTNMGLYESSQMVNLFEAVKQWCGAMGFDYCGGLGISAGELLGALTAVLPFGRGAVKKADEGIRRLASAIDLGVGMADVYAEPYLFPRSLYIQIANTSWNRTAKKNGIRPADMFRQL